MRCFVCNLARSAALTLAVMTYLGFGWTATGQAQLLPIVVCSGTDSVTYSPGVTYTPASITSSIDRKLTTCVHLVAPPLFMTGTRQGQVTATFSCSDLLADRAGVGRIDWANGESTTYDFTGTVTFVNGNVTLTTSGTVVSGRYLGKTVSTVSVYTPLLGDEPVDFVDGCNSEDGLTSLSGVISFTILP